MTLYELGLALLVAVGWAANAALVLAEATRQEGRLVTPWAYARRRPYKSALSVLGAIAFGATLAYDGSLTPITAVGAGVAADGIFEQAARVARARVN